MMPSPPSATDFTAAESVTMENTISDFSATPRGVSAKAMPALISGSALSRERFQPVTLCPASISRGTMSWPMAPSPTKPNCTAITPAFHDVAGRGNAAAHSYSRFGERGEGGQTYGSLS